jgi:formate C-acetyltransferase
MEQWKGFREGYWRSEIDVREFIQLNYKPYEGDDSFLEGPTDATNLLWEQLKVLLKKEHENGGTLGVDADTVSTIISHKPGYIDQEHEKIVGLQTDAPLKRAIMPNGGIRMVKNSCEAYGYKLDPKIEQVFTEYRKTHNQGVFDAYTPEIRRARKAGVITGLPDAYGRGRIIGDYRRVALYGIDRLIEDKQKQQEELETAWMEDETIRLREEITDQIRALKELKVMAQSYGYDIAKPAGNAHEAVQWLYFAYLGSVKEQNGAAMSLGRGPHRPEQPQSDLRQ